jgi:hypothetical protein
MQGLEVRPLAEQWVPPRYRFPKSAIELTIGGLEDAFQELSDLGS